MVDVRLDSAFDPSGELVIVSFWNFRVLIWMVSVSPSCSVSEASRSNAPSAGCDGGSESKEV